MADKRDWFGPGTLALLIALLLFGAYPGVMLGLDSFFNRDFGLFTYPNAFYAKHSLWHGEIPLWNPLNLCGVPFLAQWNTTICYPLSWIYLLLPLPWSLNYFCLGHLVLAGMGMYWLAHRWTGNRFAASIAGLAYALNGLSLNCVMWTSNLAALAWLPLVIGLVELAWREGGRRMVYAALAAAMQMLAGAPEIILITWLLLGTLWLGQVWRGWRAARFVNGNQVGRFVPPHPGPLPLGGGEGELSSARSQAGRDECSGELGTVPSVPKLGQSAQRMMALGLLVFGLCAVQLLPFFVLLQNSGAYPGQIQGVWSMPAWGWANFVVPMFRCTPSMLGPYIQAEQQWTSSYYTGLSVLGLSLIAIFRTKSTRVYWLAAAALLGMVLALGEHGFLYSLIKSVFPGFGSVRYPVKFIVLAVFAFPLLAAFGVDWREREFRVSEPPVRRSLLWAGIFLLVILVAIVLFAHLRPYPGESWGATFKNGAIRALFLALTLGALYLRVTWGPTAETSTADPSPRPSPHPMRRGGVVAGASANLLFGLIVLILLGLDLVTHTARQNPTVVNRAYGPLPLAMSARPEPGMSRGMVSPRMQVTLENAATPNPLNYYIGMRRAAYGDCNLLDGLPKVNGFYSLYLREEAQLRARIYGTTNPPPGLLDFLSVSQISSPEVMFAWNARDTYLPSITAGRQPIFLPQARILDAVTSENFDPRREVYLPMEARGIGPATNSTAAQITLPQFSAHWVTFRVTTSEPTWVVIGQTFYPCWQAYVDGQPARLWRANYVFQALAIPAGEHEVRIVYRDRMFYLGAAITLATVLALLIVKLCARRVSAVKWLR